MYALSDLLLPDSMIEVKESVLLAVRSHTMALCRRFGIIDSERMSAAKFRAGRFELLTALTYPHADLDALRLCNDFIVYLFFVDDQAEEDERYGKQTAALQRYFERHLTTLRDGAPAGADDPAGRLLLDIRARLLQRASPPWLQRFADDVSDYLLRGTLQGARHWTAGTVPSLDEYIEQRACDSAVQCAQDLLEPAGSGELPAALLERADFIELRRTCTNVVAFSNDLVSYPKEVRRHHSPNNLVHVIATHERRTVDEAIERVIAIVNAEVACFEQLAARLPRFGNAPDAAVARYLQGQRAWMAGNLRWSLATGRYVDPESPFAELRLPPRAQRPAAELQVAAH